MRQVFQQELSEVQDRLVEIAELVKIAITDATNAFNESDLPLAEQVIENDAKIDELSLSLDELSIQILARQQPVARDLLDHVVEEGHAGGDAAAASAVHGQFHADVGLRGLAVALGGSGLAHGGVTIRCARRLGKWNAGMKKAVGSTHRLI
jgi:hypothetical protein